jgi:hypothetical protein
MDKSYKDQAKDSLRAIHTGPETSQSRSQAPKRLQYKAQLDSKEDTKKG